jgi:hypothetical protein
MSLRLAICRDFAPGGCKFDVAARERCITKEEENEARTNTARMRWFAVIESPPGRYGPHFTVKNRLRTGHDPYPPFKLLSQAP